MSLIVLRLNKTMRCYEIPPQHPFGAVWVYKWLLCFGFWIKHLKLFGLRVAIRKLTCFSVILKQGTLWLLRSKAFGGKVLWWLHHPPALLSTMLPTICETIQTHFIFCTLRICRGNIYTVITSVHIYILSFCHLNCLALMFSASCTIADVGSRFIQTLKKQKKKQQHKILQLIFWGHSNTH